MLDIYFFKISPHLDQRCRSYLEKKAQQNSAESESYCIRLYHLYSLFFASFFLNNFVHLWILQEKLGYLFDMFQDFMLGCAFWGYIVDNFIFIKLLFLRQISQWAAPVFADNLNHCRSLVADKIG